MDEDETGVLGLDTLASTTHVINIRNKGSV